MGEQRIAKLERDLRLARSDSLRSRTIRVFRYAIGHKASEEREILEQLLPELKRLDKDGAAWFLDKFNPKEIKEAHGILNIEKIYQDVRPDFVVPEPEPQQLQQQYEFVATLLTPQAFPRRSRPHLSYSEGNPRERSMLALQAVIDSIQLRLEMR